MTRPADSAPPPVRAAAWHLADGLSLLALLCLAAITLVDRGATRMHAAPWSLLLCTVRFVPLAALALRAVSRTDPLRLPAHGGCVAAVAAVSVVASALASPFRGPSMLGAATLLAALAVFFLVHDWLAREPGAPGGRLALLTQLGAWCAALVAAISIGEWLVFDVLPAGDWRVWSALVAHRNASPLGHSNYTAGLALLLLPWPAACAWRARGARRAAWAAAGLLVLATLFTSGSRGGLIGLGALVVAALLLARLGWKRLALAGAVALAVGAALALANPRFRSLLRPAAPGDVVSQSNLQRSAMLTAGLRMGADRPLLGWGPETTPLVFPRYRAGLDGGAENILQLHCAPIQAWAEHGGLGLAVALAFVVLALRRAPRHPLAAATLAGYLVFSLTDWQLDVPVFAFALAALAACLAAPAPDPAPPGECNVIRYKPARAALVAGGAMAAAVLVGLLGRRDPTPEMNAEALALPREPANAARAAALLDASLALNPDQEIAQFNLGWLLVGRDPAAAEKHFLAAAHLVPDKGGVYFGLGLARLNQGRRDAAARALALECLNDPAFLASPWWREPAVAAMRAAMRAEFLRLAARAKTSLRAGSGTAAQLDRVAARALALGDVPAGPERTFFRERTGYPVLMRNLDLPAPADLFLVRESAAAPADAWPAKGWLPSPLLLQLLDAPASALPKS